MEIRSKLKNFITNKWGDICRRSHYFLMGIPFVLVIGSIVLSVASVVRINQVLDGQYLQYAAERFESKKMPYRMLTVLGPGLEQNDGSAPRKAESGLDVEKIQSIHDALDLTEKATVGNNKNSKNGTDAANSGIVNVWEDCYSSVARYPATGYMDKTPTGMVESCEVVGVSGNYQVVHPFSYESGGFLPGEDGDRYTVVLNTQLAWNLFHSYQVLGAFVEFNGTMYQIVGVVNEGTDAISETTGVTKPRAYIPFKQLAYLANGSAFPSMSSEMENSVKDTDLAVTCYEVLLTDPINNIAYNDLVDALQDTIGYSEDKSELLIINNTDRFNAISLYKKYFPLKDSYVGGNGLNVPYYERSARLAEQYVVFWAEALIVGILFLILGSCNIYAILHGSHTKHERQDEYEEEQEISYFDQDMR
ncbi:MAG: ABC transporter permease [Clostridiales bacterium]|nr:ABC transporter permease [Clostridiales bacterium]